MQANFGQWMLHRILTHLLLHHQEVRNALCTSWTPCPNHNLAGGMSPQTLKKWTALPSVSANPITSFLILTSDSCRAGKFLNLTHPLSTATLAPGSRIAFGNGTFLLAFFMALSNSLSSDSMSFFPLNRRAASNLGFSVSHCCLASSWELLDIFDHTSGLMSSGPERCANLCQSFSCPQMSVGWRCFQNCKYRESNPGSRLWSFTVDMSMVVDNVLLFDVQIFVSVSLVTCLCFRAHVFFSVQTWCRHKITSRNAPSPGGHALISSTKVEQDRPGLEVWRCGPSCLFWTVSHTENCPPTFEIPLLYLGIFWRRLSDAVLSFTPLACATPVQRHSPFKAHPINIPRGLLSWFDEACFRLLWKLED